MKSDDTPTPPVTPGPPEPPEPGPPGPPAELPSSGGASGNREPEVAPVELLGEDTAPRWAVYDTAQLRYVTAPLDTEDEAEQARATVAKLGSRGLRTRDRYQLRQV